MRLATSTSVPLKFAAAAACLGVLSTALGAGCYLRDGDCLTRPPLPPLRHPRQPPQIPLQLQRGC